MIQSKNKKDKGVIAKVASDSGINEMVTNTLDSILDMLGRPINDEERANLASNIEIVPDSEMPYTDKFPVDILLNASGAIRRLNPGQICEVDYIKIVKVNSLELLRVAQTTNTLYKG